MNHLAKARRNLIGMKVECQRKSEKQKMEKYNIQNLGKFIGRIIGIIASGWIAAFIFQAMRTQGTTNYSQITTITIFFFTISIIVLGLHYLDPIKFEINTKSKDSKRV